MPHSLPVAFQLSQLGALAAAKFADLVRPHGLTASDAGVLRLLGRQPDISQRALADQLGAVPSRVVALIDSLQQRGLVQRTRSETDRRNQQLTLTDEGRHMLGTLRHAAEQHEKDLLASLSPTERQQLGDLLAKLAREHHLDPDVHPGYRRGSRR